MRSKGISAIGKALILRVSVLTVLVFPVLSFAGEPPITFPVTETDYKAIRPCTTGSPHHLSNCKACDPRVSTSNAYVNYSILVNALQKAGMQTLVSVISSPNSERGRKLVLSGGATIRGDWDFNIDGEQSVYRTDAYILPGTIAKGLYGLTTNPLLKGISNQKELRKLTAAMNPTWRLDWNILARMGLRSLKRVSTKPQMFTLVAKRGVDFTLLEFSSFEDMRQTSGNIYLTPAEGVKVLLPNSQHFMISKKAPHAAEIQTSINKGLAILHKNGFIQACLKHSGIINSRVESWTVLNPDTPPLKATD